MSTQGDGATWFAFFLKTLAEQAGDAARRACRLHDLRSEMRQRVAAPRASALLPLLVDQLFLSPAITIAAAQDVLHVTHRWASQSVDKLCEAGILAETAPAGRTRLFIAPEIIREIEGAARRHDLRAACVERRHRDALLIAGRSQAASAEVR